jgi:hypothetical protein
VDAAIESIEAATVHRRGELRKFELRSVSAGEITPRARRSSTWNTTSITVGAAVAASSPTSLQKASSSRLFTGAT